MRPPVGWMPGARRGDAGLGQSGSHPHRDRSSAVHDPAGGAHIRTGKRQGGPAGARLTSCSKRRVPSAPSRCGKWRDGPVTLVLSHHLQAPASTSVVGTDLPTDRYGGTRLTRTRFAQPGTASAHAAPIQVAQSFLSVPKRPTSCDSPASCGKKTYHRPHHHQIPPKTPSSDTAARRHFRLALTLPPSVPCYPAPQLQPATQVRDSRPYAHFPPPRTSLPPNPLTRPPIPLKPPPKPFPRPPIQPHDQPNALLELAEMRGNERKSTFPSFHHTITSGYA